MKKLSISFLAVAVVVFAIASAFTTVKHNFTSTVYKIEGVSTTLQPSGSDISSPDWYDANNVSIVTTKNNTTFTSTELDNVQAAHCNASDLICFAEVKYKDGTPDPDFTPVVRLGDFH